MKKRGILEYYDSDRQIESWEREKAKLQVVCDNLSVEMRRVDLGADNRVTKVKFKEVLIR